MIIPQELDYILNLQERKDAKQRILKVYEALLFKRNKNKNWFDCPSNYLRSINSQYHKVMPLLLKYGIIEYMSIDNEVKYEDIFTSNVYKKKFYKPSQSMKYRFLIDTTIGYEYNLNIDSSYLYEKEKWYMKTKFSLLELGFMPEEIKIKRDNFSRRLHTNITSGVVGDYRSYKDLLAKSNYCIIDSKTSQPRLLWLTMRDIGLQDHNLNRIFENNIDFYDFIIERIPEISCRDEAKELFVSWVNGKGYLEDDKSYIRDLFKVANTYIRNYKSSSYKDICKLLQNKEANIFIDDLLNNIPLEFCLTIHDSLIVRKEDVKVALNFCKEKHPELIFNVEEIKSKNKK